MVIQSLFNLWIYLVVELWDLSQYSVTYLCKCKLCSETWSKHKPQVYSFSIVIVLSKLEFIKKICKHTRSACCSRSSSSPPPSWCSTPCMPSARQPRRCRLRAPTTARPTSDAVFSIRKRRSPRRTAARVRSSSAAVFSRLREHQVVVLLYVQWGGAWELRSLLIN